MGFDAIRWIERAEGRSWRLSNDHTLDTASIGAIRSAADPDWADRSYSLEAHSSTEAFNRLVGWVTVGYHWAVVRHGGVIGAGDVETLEEAMACAEAIVKVRKCSKQEES